MNSNVSTVSTVTWTFNRSEPPDLQRACARACEQMTLIFDAAHGIEDDKQQVELINALTDTLRRFHTAHLSRCVAVRVAVAHASGPEAGY